MYLLQEQIKEKMFNISTPGMRSFLAQEDGKRLIAAVEQEQKCIIEITEQNGDQHEVDESDDDEPLSTSSDGEDELDENKETIVTSAGKKVIWKTGNIEEEKVCLTILFALIHPEKEHQKPNQNKQVNEFTIQRFCENFISFTEL